MRATVETHETCTTLPVIKLRVALGEEDLTIKVEEENCLHSEMTLGMNNNLSGLQLLTVVAEHYNYTIHVPYF